MTGGVRDLAVHLLGRVDYGGSLDLQERLLQARISDDISDSLLLLEHEPVITMGFSAKQEHLLQTNSALRDRGIEVIKVSRGGDVTYHGPGQLVAYAIVDLKPNQRDVKRYVWNLEEVLLRVTTVFGLSARRIENLHGIWIEDRKIGAVGVRIKRWVTMHGFSLNVSTDLSAYDLIVPCGIEDKQVTSLQRELQQNIKMDTAFHLTAEKFAEVFGRRIVWM
ncbi:MAG: lipoyl(octanoyl) transferase LipB [Deltaproteobacteria bacterium]|nr:lipoyl(octanoyl) transferase LipB [Deltaproteobacteria bacterium]